MQEVSPNDIFTLYYRLVIDKRTIEYDEKLPERLDFTLKECEMFAEQLMLPQVKQLLADLRNRLPKDNPEIIKREWENIQTDIRSITKIYLDLLSKQKYALLEDSNACERLQDIGAEQLSEQGALFKSEVEKCLQVGAFRATIVNAWAMVTDFIQSWIICKEERRLKFNDRLAKFVNSKKQERMFADISNKGDFWGNKSPSERVLLECVKEQIGDNTYNQCVALLDNRNLYAHANEKKLGIDKVRGYVSGVVDVIEDIHQLMDK